MLYILVFYSTILFLYLIFCRDEGGDSNVVQKQFDVEEVEGDEPEEREQSPTAFLADAAPDDGADSIRLTVIFFNSDFIFNFFVRHDIYL